MDTWVSFPGQEQSQACRAVLALMSKVHAMAVVCFVATGSDPMKDPNVRMLANDMARRLHVSVVAHVGRFSYSMIGALQLKRDLGEYQVWDPQP